MTSRFFDRYFVLLETLKKLRERILKAWVLFQEPVTLSDKCLAVVLL